MLEVLKAIGFMVIDGVFVEIYNRRIWQGYREGRKDGAGSTYHR